MSAACQERVQSSNGKSLPLLGLIAHILTRRRYGFGRCGGEGGIRTHGTVRVADKHSKFNEASRPPISRRSHGLVAGSSAVRTNNEINSSSEPVCGRGGLSPQGSGKCLHRQGGLRGSSLTPKKLDNKETAGSFFPFCSPWYPIVRWVYSRRSTSASPGHDARDDQRGCAAGEQLPWSCSSTASPR
jgi:hypothetical protein